MEWLPHRTRLDVERLKAAQELVALATRRKKRNRQPVIRSRRRREQIALPVLRIPLEVRLALPENRGKPAELRKAKRGEDVAQPVVVADFLMLVPDALLARLL